MFLQHLSIVKCIWSCVGLLQDNQPDSHLRQWQNVSGSAKHLSIRLCSAELGSAGEDNYYWLRRQEKSYFYPGQLQLSVEVWRKLRVWLILCNEVVQMVVLLCLFCLLRKLDILWWSWATRLSLRRMNQCQSASSCASSCVGLWLWLCSPGPAVISTTENKYYDYYRALSQC